MGAAVAAGKKKLGRSIILGAAFALGMLALMWYASTSLAKHACEVCISFKGGSVCRKADGASVEEARRTATDMACAEMASGMNESLACQRTEPKSVSCDEAYAPRQGR